MGLYQTKKLCIAEETQANISAYHAAKKELSKIYKENTKLNNNNLIKVWEEEINGIFLKKDI